MNQNLRSLRHSEKAIKYGKEEKNGGCFEEHPPFFNEMVNILRSVSSWYFRLKHP